MRHQKAGVKLNRTTSHRDAMLRNMVTSLLEYGHVKTTDAKAKEIRRWADKMVTLAKRGDVHARRQAMAVVRKKDVVAKLFEEAGERFGQMAGGYTRVLKIGFRKGDSAPLSLVEWTGIAPAPKEKKKAAKEKAQEAPKEEAQAAKDGESEAPASSGSANE
jgi:large subunit ribosomal protein L17